MKARTQSARNWRKSWKQGTTIIRPTTGVVSPRMAFTMQRPPEKDEISQETFVKSLTHELDKKLSCSREGNKAFAIHQEIFAKLIQRFDLKNHAFSKVKEGYESIFKNLKGMEREVIAEMSMKSVSASVQNEVSMMQEKIKTKRAKLRDLNFSLDSLIDDLRKENADHMREISTLKEENSDLERQNLDAEATYVELEAKHKKKQEKYAKAHDNEEEMIKKESDIKKQIKDQEIRTSILINELMEGNAEHAKLVDEIRKLENEKTELINNRNKTNEELTNKEHQISLIRSQLEAIGKEIEDIKAKDEKVQFTLNKTARRLSISSKTLYTLSSPVEYLQACIEKYHSI